VRLLAGSVDLKIISPTLRANKYPVELAVVKAFDFLKKKNTNTKMRVLSLAVFAVLVATLYAASITTWIGSTTCVPATNGVYSAVVVPNDACTFATFSGQTGFFKVSCPASGNATACISTTSDCATCTPVTIPYATDACVNLVVLSAKFSCSNPSTPAGAITTKYFSDTKCQTASAGYAWSFPGYDRSATCPAIGGGRYFKSATCTDDGTSLTSTSTTCTSSDCSTGCTTTNATTVPKCNALGATGSIQATCGAESVFRGFVVAVAALVALFAFLL